MYLPGQYSESLTWGEYRNGASCEMLLVTCYNATGINGVCGLYLYGVFKIIVGSYGCSGKNGCIYGSNCEKF